MSRYSTPQVQDDGSVVIGTGERRRSVVVSPAGIEVWGRQRDAEGWFEVIVEKYDRAPLNPSTTGWQASANCRALPTHLWFPGRGEPTDIARAVCATCPVGEQCAADAARPVDGYTRVKWGVWGGKSERQRRGPRVTARHGSRSKYNSGCRCEPCTAANRLELRRQRARAKW